MSGSRFRTSPDWAALALLTVAWALPVAWIGLHGRFCLYDDWAYAQTVHHWLETGQFARPKFIYAPTFSNALIGLAFTKVFGFSFPVLRASTFVVGWMGILATYGLCRQLGALPGAAGLAAATLAFNPLYFHLSYTFMTDVAFTAFVVGGVAAFARGLDRRSAVWLTVATLLAAAAVLSRSPGIALPIAMGLALLGSRIREPRTWVVVAVALAAAALLYLWGPGVLFSAQDSGMGVSLRWYVEQNLLRTGLLYDLGRNGLTLIYLLGLSLAPLVLARKLPSGRGRWLFIAGAALAAPVLIVLVHRPPPYAIDQIRNVGLGAITVSGSSRLPAAPAALWICLASLGFACAAAALLSLAETFLRRRQAFLLSPGPLAAALFPIVYLAPLWIQWPYLDRWILPVVPLLLALLAAAAPLESRGRRLLRGSAWLVVLAAFAVVGTRDQLVLHRAMANLTQRVLAMGYSPSQVDAGTGFNGWYHWDDPNVRNSDPLTGDRWVVDDRVVLSLKERLPGYEPLERVRYRTWMPPAEITLTAFLRRGPGTRPLPRTSGRQQGAGPSPARPSAPRSASRGS